MAIKQYLLNGEKEMPKEVTVSKSPTLNNKKIITTFVKGLPEGHWLRN